MRPGMVCNGIVRSHGATGIMRERLQIMSEQNNTRVIQTEISGDVLTIRMAGQPTIRVDAATLSKDIQQQAMMHGLKQKIGDAAAAAKGTPPVERHAAMMVVVEALARGEWNAKRATGGAGDGLVVEALARAYGKTLAWADAQIDALAVKLKVERKVAVAKFKMADKVAAKIVEIMAERAGGNADALLSELSE